MLSGANATKFLTVLLIIFFIPSYVNKFSTAISFDSNSPVDAFTILYVDCT